jgi:hypothetical protein
MLQTNDNQADTFTVNGKTYQGLIDSKAAVFADFNNVGDLKVNGLDGIPVSVSGILDQALVQFGKDTLQDLFDMTNNFVVFYQGNFYNVYRKSGSSKYRIRPMKLKD